MSDSKAVMAMRASMEMCPEEFKGSVALKGVWVAGFMRGYRFKQEEGIADGHLEEH